MLAERQPENKVTVPANSRPTHPLVKTTSAVLRAVRPDEYGRLHGSPRALDLTVSRGRISRALRIAEALVRALEARGHQVTMSDGKTYAVVRGEQQRIVEAIDSYLTRLNDAVASLERAQAKLKAYRPSVLKAAVEGRLVPTEASLARAEKRAYETAEALLVRILNERRRRWEEAQLAKFKATGKTPKDESGRPSTRSR